LNSLYNFIKEIMKEYDFAISWSVKERELFVATLKKACKERGLSFLWISDENINDIIKALENHELRVRFLLDTEATYNKNQDIYARLCYAVKDGGGVVVNDPDRTRVAVDKSVMHYELINAGINTPYSVIVRNWEPNSFKLTDEEKQNLGIPFVIKPACGYARQGVIEEACGSIREIAHARKFDRGDNFLLQERISPIELNGRRAWFRVFHVFDRIIPCWWDDITFWYEHVTEEEFRNYRLSSLAKIVSQIADLTRMQWFSTEIAIDKKFGQFRFVAIDYVNDQCDMTAQSCDKTGVPDAVVEFIANLTVESAYKLINNEEINKNYTIWLKDTENLQVRGLGKSPQPLIQVSY
jgi:hypothetical protein